MGDRTARALGRQVVAAAGQGQATQGSDELSCFAGHESLLDRMLGLDRTPYSAAVSP